MNLNFSSNNNQRGKEIPKKRHGKSSTYAMPLAHRTRPRPTLRANLDKPDYPQK